MDGEGFEDINPTIRVKSVLIGATEVTQITSAAAKYSGVRYLGQREETRSIRILFKILDIDPVRREAILCDILDWARGVKLEAVQRPDQYINVYCTEFPSQEMARDYADNELAITFTAYDPDFKSIQPTVVNTTTVAATPKDVTIIPPGTQDITFLEAEITNSGSTTMNTATIAVNGRTFAFSALGLAAGKVLVIARDVDCRLTMTIDSVSVMGKRTDASDDDLVLIQRAANTVTLTTANDCAVKLSARGQYR